MRNLLVFQRLYNPIVIKATEEAMIFPSWNHAALGCRYSPWRQSTYILRLSKLLMVSDINTVLVEVCLFVSACMDLRSCETVPDFLGLCHESRLSFQRMFSDSVHGVLHFFTKMRVARASCWTTIPNQGVKEHLHVLRLARRSATGVSYETPLIQKEVLYFNYVRGDFFGSVNSDSHDALSMSLISFITIHVRVLLSVGQWNQVTHTSFTH